MEVASHPNSYLSPVDQKVSDNLEFTKATDIESGALKTNIRVKPDVRKELLAGVSCRICKIWLGGKSMPSTAGWSMVVMSRVIYRLIKKLLVLFKYQLSLFVWTVILISLYQIEYKLPIVLQRKKVSLAAFKSSCHPLTVYKRVKN